MMIFYRERLAFLAVPKTGTSALERALGSKASAIFRDPPGIKHTNARRFESKYRKLFDHKDYPPIETMAVMREPVEWLGSWYRYRQRPALSGHVNSTEGVSFDSFVESYLKPNQPPYANVGSQARFVTDNGGNLLVNHLFSYEDLPIATGFLERRLNCSISLKPVNESPKREINLSKELEQEFHRIYALDFEIYKALQDGPLSIS
ncbi:gamma-glutamyl kinase [uncultured Litoreibacter sp.]|uniref:gamma-glutamyl kinase n=1 Tax=uncultured Litoreibacter sp. TaxID=1392394 RepID=UPI0026331243|nr:gamma-glutamyl kinase [uncultured Litoreibacter sp.]